MSLPYSQAWYDTIRATIGDQACRQLGIYVIPADFLLSVVVPAYNEQDTLGEIDETWKVMQEIPAEFDSADNRIVLKRHEVNQGKGRALRTGFAAATGTVVCVQDADLEYDPAEFPRLLHPIVDGRADVVYGSRFLGEQAHRVLYFWHYLGNKVLTTASNCFTNLNLTDMETCYKLFRREVMAEVLPTLRQDRFGFEPEVTAKVARRQYRVFEMSVSYSGRTYAQGKKIGWKDGVQALWCIVRYGLAD